MRRNQAIVFHRILVTLGGIVKEILAIVEFLDCCDFDKHSRMI